MQKDIKNKFIAPIFVDKRTLIYRNQNDFIKKYKGLRRICPMAFKYLCFEVFKKNLFQKKDGEYAMDLPTDKLFKRIYGQVKIIYTVYNNKIVIENLEPENILLANYMADIKIFKGIPYSNEKDKFKIELIERILMMEDLEDVQQIKRI